MLIFLHEIGGLQPHPLPTKREQYFPFAPIKDPEGSEDA
jgi:hypothetical protein